MPRTGPPFWYTTAGAVVAMLAIAAVVALAAIGAVSVLS